MLLLVDIVSGGTLKENMQMEVLYTLAKMNLLTEVNYVRMDMDILGQEVDVDLKLVSYACICFEPISVSYAYSFMKKVKKNNPNCIIFAVGCFATYSCSWILKECDYVDHVILGDYEYPVIEIVNSLILSERTDKYLYCDVTRYSLSDIDKKRLNIFDMKSYPFVLDRILMKKSMRGRLPVASIETARGCVGRCSFCRMNYAHGSKYITWRCRPVDDAYKEMVDLYLKYGITVFLISDSAIEVPAKFGKERVNELCDLLINSEYRFSLRCSVRISSFGSADIELIKKMKRAGFIEILLGIESVNADDQVLYNKTFSTDQANLIISMFKECGIISEIGFINFNPYSTLISLKENFNFLKLHGYFFDYYFLTRLDVEYNTPLYKKLSAEKKLEDTYSYINVCGYCFESEEVKGIEERLSNALCNVAYRESEMRYIDFSVMFPAVMRCFDETVCVKYQVETNPVIERIKFLKYAMIEELMFGNEDIAKIMGMYGVRLKEAYEELDIKIMKFARNREYVRYLNWTMGKEGN